MASFAMKKIRIFPCILLALALVACSPSEYKSADARSASSADSVVASENTYSKGATLAYEHIFHIKLPADKIANRAKNVQSACVEARFGDCQILRVWQQGESEFRLAVRIQPTGVDPIVALARGEDGKTSYRETRAEDLAEAIVDNRRQAARLKAYGDRLESLAERTDITLAELIDLAREQADVQQILESTEKDAAQHQRRIDAHLLEIYFIDAQIGERARPSKMESLADLFFEGLYDALAFAFYGFPFLILFFCVGALLRWVWRTLFRRKMKVASADAL
ncbi:MAG: DUF4349 domain-containing protein [Helicobacteraceae bacterium]|jgi:hypothetical protein|nr:DUF4349 domain-containing protein [Helicobacteraceae bacterium]